MNESLAIGFRRRLAAVFAAVFAVLAVSGAWQAISAGEALALTVTIVAFGGVSAVYAVHALHRRPVLILDAHGLTDVRRGIAVGWREIEAAHIAERPRSLDPNHELVLQVEGGRRLSLPLDHLTSTWHELGRIIEARLGREVSVRREPGGLLSRTRRSLAV